MSYKMTDVDWKERRDDLNEISHRLADALFSIARIKRLHINDERFFSQMAAIGKTIYGEHQKILDEKIVCNVEIDRLQKPKD